MKRKVTTLASATSIRLNSEEKTLIAGIGNKLLGDDGFGPYVIELLESAKLSSNIETLDFGTAGITKATDLKGYDRVIFIDAIQRGGDPGAIYREDFTPNQVKDIKPDQSIVQLSLHEAKLEELLSFAKAIGSLPQKITVIGCEPEVLEPRIGLSPGVEQAARNVAELIVRGQERS